MEAGTGFHDLMRSLWKVMNIDLPSGTMNEVYSIMFANQVEVHLLSTHAGKLDIISEAGMLRNKQAGTTLLDLIALNHPPLTVNIDHATGCVMVWSRQEIEGIEMEKLVELIANLVGTVQQAKQYIDCRDTQELLTPIAKHDVMYAPRSGEATLAQLRRRN